MAAHKTILNQKPAKDLIYLRGYKLGVMTGTYKIANYFKDRVHSSTFTDDSLDDQVFPYLEGVSRSKPLEFSGDTVAQLNDPTDNEGKERKFG